MFWLLPWALAPAHVAQDRQKLELPSETTEVTPASLGWDCLFLYEKSPCSCSKVAHT